MAHFRIHYLSLFILAFILSSCTDKHADSLIAEAQQLLSTKPDSQLYVILLHREN